MKSFEQIAQAMYEAYIKVSPRTLWRPWEYMPKHQRESWIAAAKAAHKEITEVH